MKKENRYTFYDQSIKAIEKDAKKEDKIEHFHFLHHLINIQGIHDYKTATQYEKVYLKVLDTQLTKYLKREEK